MKYKIYAGLGGGFGGANYQYTDDFASQSDAINAAYECALEEYEGYEGLHGLRSIDDIMEEDGIDDYDDALASYEEERESWLDYYAKLDDGKEED